MCIIYSFSITKIRDSPFSLFSQWRINSISKVDKCLIYGREIIEVSMDVQSIVVRTIERRGTP